MLHFNQICFWHVFIELSDLDYEIMSLNKKFVLYSVLLLSVILFVTPDRIIAQTLIEQDTLKIGLLISSGEMKEAKRGAELAIQEANRIDFLQDKNIHLITRSMEGPWGTGAKQTVDLVFNEKVWAIIGSNDGRNAHLAEQVTAKTQQVYISVLSGDPTLAQAYVPWFFSLVPNNIQQAKSLYKEIYGESDQRVLIIADKDYDTENALGFFMDEISSNNRETPVVIKFNTLDFDIDLIAKSVNSNNPEVIVFFTYPEETAEILSILIKMRGRFNIYGTFTVLGENPISVFNPDDFEGMIVPDVRYLSSRSGKNFLEQYDSKFGTRATPTAAYAYDAVWLILWEIQKSDFNHEIFKQRMRNAEYEGVTGIIRFDDIGNRVQDFKWIKLEDRN